MKEGIVVKTIQNEDETIIFRYPRWQDVPEYVEMCNILHGERVMAYHMETDFSRGCERLSGILVGLETENCSHLLVEADGKIIGEGSIKRGSAHQPGSLGIKIIGRYRRRGLGTEMMYLLEAEALKLGLERIYLVAWSLNTPAIHLYKKVGYREVGRMPDWFGAKDEKGELILSDRIDMIKDIEESDPTPQSATADHYPEERR